jgi:hypothetical protein
MPIIVLATQIDLLQPMSPPFCFAPNHFMDVNWARKKTTANFVVILLRPLHSNDQRGIRRAQIGANNDFLPCLADDDALALRGVRAWGA